MQFVYLALLEKVSFIRKVDSEVDFYGTDWEISFIFSSKCLISAIQICACGYNIVLK